MVDQPNFRSFLDISINCAIFTVRNSSCGKVMFSKASVILSTRGAVHGVGGMHGRGSCVAGGCARQRVCVAGGVCGGECARQGACVAGDTTTATDGTHPTGMHSCFIYKISVVRF